MKITRFDRKRDLIIVRARAWSPRNHGRLRLAVDTGSSDTVVTPVFVEQLGYSVRDGERVMTVRSAIGREQGFTLCVKRFSALGFVVPNYLLHVEPDRPGHLAVALVESADKKGWPRVFAGGIALWSALAWGAYWIDLADTGSG